MIGNHPRKEQVSEVLARECSLELKALQGAPRHLLSMSLFFKFKTISKFPATMKPHGVQTPLDLKQVSIGHLHRWRVWLNSSRPQFPPFRWKKNNMIPTMGASNVHEAHLMPDTLNDSVIRSKFF